MASGTLRFFFACFMPGLGAAAAGRQFLLSFGRSVLPVSVRILSRCGRRHFVRGGIHWGAEGSTVLPTGFR